MEEKLLNFCIIFIGMIHWKSLPMLYMFVFFVLLGLLFITTKIKKNLNTTSVISLIKCELLKLLIIKYVIVVLGPPIPVASHYRVVPLSFDIFLRI